MTIWVQWIDKNPSFLEGRKSDKRRALMIGCLVDDQSGYNYISGFLCTTSSFTQVILRELIGMTWDKQSQSSISIWATALMWQIWERWCVRDRRGTQWNSGARGADAQSRLGKLACRPWHVAPLLSRHSLHETLAGLRQRWRLWQLAYFHPTLLVCLHQNQWVLLISPPISERRIHVCLSCVSLLSICSYFLLSFTILPPCLGVF